MNFTKSKLQYLVNYKFKTKKGKIYPSHSNKIILISKIYVKTKNLDLSVVVVLEFIFVVIFTFVENLEIRS